MRNIIAFFIDRPKVVNLILIFIFLSGFLAMKSIQNQGYPAVDFGAVNINTVYPGASPEDIELKITTKLEEQLKSVTGIKMMNSGSIENFSMINILLEDSADYDKALLDIQKAVDKTSDLPEDLPALPTVTEINNDRIPVMEVAITGPGDYRKKRAYALALEKKLLADPLIGSVSKFGYRKQETVISASQSKLKSNYVSLSGIIQSIQSHNLRLTGGDGTFPDGEKTFVVLSEISPPQTVKDIIIRSGFEGNSVRISDVATIENTFTKPEKLIRFNSQESINIIIIKKETMTWIFAKGTFYHYFETKEDLLDQLIENRLQQNLGLIREILENATLSFYQKFNQIFTICRTLKVKNKSIIGSMLKSFYTEDLNIIKSKVANHSLKLFAPLFAECITQGQVAGKFRVQHPLQTAELVLLLAFQLNETVAKLLLNLKREPESAGNLVKIVESYEEAAARILCVDRRHIRLFDLNELLEKAK